MTNVYINDINYTINNLNRFAIINSNNQFNTNLVNVIIPPTIRYNNINYIVNGITNDAFQFCENLESIIITNNIPTFPANTIFEGCIHLETIIMAGYHIINGIRYLLRNNNNSAIIGSYNKNNLVLNNITIPTIITYNNINYNVNSIDIDSFQHCENLKYININSNINPFPTSIFNGCNYSTLQTIILNGNLITLTSSFVNG
jgi:hypothetical protein